MNWKPWHQIHIFVSLYYLYHAPVHNTGKFLNLSFPPQMLQLQMPHLTKISLFYIMRRDLISPRLIATILIFPKFFTIFVNPAANKPIKKHGKHENRLVKIVFCRKFIWSPWLRRVNNTILRKDIYWKILYSIYNQRMPAKLMVFYNLINQRVTKRSNRDKSVKLICKKDNAHVCLLIIFLKMKMAVPMIYT